MVDNRLYSLLKVVELGSYTKAAEQLSLSQPAVSQHIRQLEDSLNVKIFEHAHNKFRLTSEGEIVVKYARQMIALENNLEQALKNERGRTRSLTIGITHTAESSAIIEALVACTNRYEGLNLRILTNTADQLYTMLKKGHHGVQLTPEEWRRLTVFMDAQGAYLSHDHDVEAQLQGKVVPPILE